MTCFVLVSTQTLMQATASSRGHWVCTFETGRRLCFRRQPAHQAHSPSRTPHQPRAAGRELLGSDPASCSLDRQSLEFGGELTYASHRPCRNLRLTRLFGKAGLRLAERRCQVVYLRRIEEDSAHGRSSAQRSTRREGRRPWHRGESGRLRALMVFRVISSVPGLRLSQKGLFGHPRIDPHSAEPPAVPGSQKILRWQPATHAASMVCSTTAPTHRKPPGSTRPPRLPLGG